MKRIMKTWTVSLLLVTAVAANAQQKQSLKDLLYSGKLKSDSGSVVRKDDDLTTKIDTGTRKPVAENTASLAIREARPADAVQRISSADTAKLAQSEAWKAQNGEAAAKEATDEVVAAPESAKPVVKSNTKIWKEYTDAMLSSFKTDLLPNKKIKKDSYFVIVEYELDTDGKVNVLNVTSSPENALIQSEVKNRLDNSPPQLAPSFDSTGKAKKIKRKQSFTVTKE